MRVEISEEVWNEIAKHGKFGETEDDVLRRLLKITAARNEAPTSPQSSPPKAAPRAGQASRERFATTRMSSYVRDGSLVVEFSGGPRKTFTLPNRDDKPGIRLRRDEAVDFARRSGASYGQQMAVKKALTEAGYHLVK